MRDIKYRVWDVVNKEYSYPGSKEFLLSMSGYLYDGLGCIYDEQHIVQQYTGLKDKNGKEIYEGDIISIYNNGNDTTLTYQVEWVDEMGAWSFCAFLMLNAVLHNNVKTFEIIGNICENPEQLNTNV